MEYTLDDIRHNLEVMANRIDQLGWTIEGVMTYTLETILNGENVTIEGLSDLYVAIDKGTRLVSEGSGKVTIYVVDELGFMRWRKEIS